MLRMEWKTILIGIQGWAKAGRQAPKSCYGAGAIGSGAAGTLGAAPSASRA
jgi:hypothetical protein